jgi:hypothetical protein
VVGQYGVCGDQGLCRVRGCDVLRLGLPRLFNAG